MRRTVLAVLAMAAMVAGCQPSTETTGGEAPEAGQTTAPPPEMPADAPPQEEIDPTLAAQTGEDVPFSGGRPMPGSCRGEIGDVAAARLVARCIAVSPATHPPCNVANPCEMIQGEIDRSCEMFGSGGNRPAECGV